MVWAINDDRARYTICFFGLYSLGLAGPYAPRWRRPDHPGIGLCEGGQSGGCWFRFSCPIILPCDLRKLRDARTTGRCISRFHKTWSFVRENCRERPVAISHPQRSTIHISLPPVQHVVGQNSLLISSFRYLGAPRENGEEVGGRMISDGSS